MTLAVRAAAAVALVAIGATVAWCAKSTPTAGPAKVQTDTVFMERERVPVKPSLGQKFTTAAVKPRQTRVADAPSSQGLQAVAIYCREPVKLALTDTFAVKDSTPKFQSVLPDFAGRKAGPRLSLYSTLNDGRRWSADYRARGRISWTSSGDSVLVRGDRLWIRILRGAASCAPAMAGSGGTGALVDREDRLRGFLLGSLSAAAGCIF